MASKRLLKSPSRAKESSRSLLKTKEESRALVMQTLDKKIEMQKLRFHQQVGGWIGSVADVCNTGVSKYKVLWDRKRLQEANQLKSQQKVMAARSYKTTMSRGAELDADDPQECADAETDLGNGEEVDVEELMSERPRSTSPFKSHKEIKQEVSDQLALWKAPESGRGESFYFNRPSSEKLSSFTSPMALVQRLRKIIADKDRHITILRQQLFKIHKESSAMAEQIASNRGPDAAQLKRQNHLLKDQLERCINENILLRGFQMQSTNGTIKRLQEKEARDKHFIRYQHPRPRSTVSCPSARSSREKVSLRSKSARPCTAVSFASDRK